MFLTLLQVALGGAIGASGRYLTGLAALRLMEEGSNGVFEVLDRMLGERQSQS